MLFDKNLDIYEKRILALAGVFQSCILVHYLANTGQCDEEAFATAIDSIFVLDSKDILSIFGGMKGVALGLLELQRIYTVKQNNAAKPSPLVGKYILANLTLQKQLQKKVSLQKEMRKRIQQIDVQSQYFSRTHENIIANLADLYNNSMTSFRYRIQVVGKAQFLEQNKILEKIRALFLAALRAAYLWHQLGGRRWQFLFAKKHYAAAVQSLLRKS